LVDDQDDKSRSIPDSGYFTTSSPFVVWIEILPAWCQATRSLAEPRNERTLNEKRIAYSVFRTFLAGTPYAISNTNLIGLKNELTLCVGRSLSSALEPWFLAFLFARIASQVTASTQGRS
jgi:hypothetical protein